MSSTNGKSLVRVRLLRLFNGGKNRWFFWMNVQLQALKHCIEFLFRFLLNLFYRTLSNISDETTVSSESDVVAVDLEDENDSQPIAKRKRSTDNTFDKLASTYERNSAERMKILQQKPFLIEPMTALGHFFSSICKTVEKFSEYEQARVKFEISNLIGRIEMGRLRDDSHIIPSYQSINVPSHSSLQYIPQPNHSHFLPPQNHQYAPHIVIAHTDTQSHSQHPAPSLVRHEIDFTHHHTDHQQILKSNVSSQNDYTVQNL